MAADLAEISIYSAVDSAHTADVTELDYGKRQMETSAAIKSTGRQAGGARQVARVVDDKRWLTQPSEMDSAITCK